MADSAATQMDLEWLLRLLPWGWKYDLLSVDMGTRLGAYGMMIAFTAIFYGLAITVGANRCSMVAATAETMPRERSSTKCATTPRWRCSTSRMRRSPNCARSHPSRPVRRPNGPLHRSASGFGNYPTS